MVVRGMSSTVNRASAITVFVNSGLRTESRPTSARNWISRKETGETPQGRYRSNHGNSASRFEPRTSQIRKWVSRRSVTALPTVAKRVSVQNPARPKTIRPRSRLVVRGGGVCTAGQVGYSETWPHLLCAVLAGVLCAARQLPRRREPRRGDETNVFSPQMRLHASCVQCT